MNNFFTSALRAVSDRLSGKADKENEAGGFAGGKDAKAVNSDMNDIDAIQLGTGTNSTPKTLQVYDYRLMNADGTVPDKRIPQLKGKLDCKISKDEYIDMYTTPGLYYLNVTGIYPGEPSDGNDGSLVAGQVTEPFYMYVSTRDVFTVWGGTSNIAQHRIKEGTLQKRDGEVAIDWGTEVSRSWGKWQNYLTDADVGKLLEGYQTKLTFDNTPTAGSDNPVTSGGVANAVNNLSDRIETVDDNANVNIHKVSNDISDVKERVASLESNMSNANANINDNFSDIQELKNITIPELSDRVSQKQDKLTFDETPTAGSDNPVTSGGICDAFSEIQSGMTDISNYATENRSRIGDIAARVTENESQIGDIDTALDSIIAIQNALIGGETS